MLARALEDTDGGRARGELRGWGGDFVADGPGLQNIHADGLGSIVATTDAAGNVTSRRQYDAWGNLEVGADQPGYAFTGREWDPETGLYYYRARYYDPKIGRFISEDPIGFAGGSNFYSYVSGQPTNFGDPLGLADPPHLVIYYGSMSPATAGVIAHRVAMGLMASDRIGTPTYELRPGTPGSSTCCGPVGLRARSSWSCGTVIVAGRTFQRRNVGTTLLCLETK